MVKLKTINREIVAAMIFSKDGKLLLGKKFADGGGVYVDTWHIPGGGVEEGEDLKTAICREINEEVGIDIARYEIELFDDQGYGESERVLNGERVLCQMHFSIFKINIADKMASEIKIKFGSDLEKVEWTDINDLNKFKLTPPSIELFTRKGII